MADAIQLSAHQAFSTPRQLRGALDHLRYLAGATSATLVVFELPNRWLQITPHTSEVLHARPRARSTYVRTRKLFKSLLLVTHEQHHEERRLQGLFNKATIEAGIEVPLYAHKWSTPALKSLLDLTPFPELLSHGVSALEGVSPSGHTDAVHPMKLLVLLGFRDNRTVLPRAFEAELTTLFDLVGRSEAVAVNRSLALASTIDVVLKLIETHLQTVQLAYPIEANEPELRELRDLSALSLRVAGTALLLTGSETSDLILTGKDPDTLYRAASCTVPAGKFKRVGNAAIQLSSVAFDTPLIPLIPTLDHIGANPSSQSVIEYVNRTVRPLVLNGIQDFLDSHDAVHYARASPFPKRLNIATQKELAVPVANSGMLPKGHPGVFGVLNLEKRDGTYGNNDLFIARHLAQYFCLQRAHILAEHANTVAISLVQAATVPNISSADLVRSYCTLDHRAITSDDDVPLEFSLARASIQVATEALYLATRSSHVTVRLAGLDNKTLWRFSEWPVGRGPAEHMRIASHNPSSVNAWVFRNGKPCSLRNVNYRPDFLQYPGLTNVLKTARQPRKYPTDVTSTEEYCKAEYCVPLVLRGRTVGTVDLESNFVGAYAVETSFIELIIRNIELVLLRAQQTFEYELFMILATTRSGSHEILHIADRLAEAAKLQELATIQKRSETLSLQLRAIISQISKIPFNLPFVESGTLLDVIDSARGQSDLFYDLELSDTEQLADLKLGKDLAFRLSLILKLLVRNAASAVCLTPQGTVKISPKIITRSGKSVLAIAVRNPIRLGQIPPTTKARALFRVPIAEDINDRWHLGTFIAGVLARSLGGDIFAVFSEPRLYAQITVEVPLPQNI